MQRAFRPVRRPVLARRAASIRLPGIINNGVFAFDSAALSITSDIDLRVQLSMDNWVPAASSTLIAKDTTTNRSYNLYIDTAGKLRLYLNPTGGSGAGVEAICSVATGFAALSKNWVRATWRNSDNVVQFFSAPGHLKDPQAGDWTQMGTDGSISLTAIFDGTALLEIGSCFGITALLLTNANVYRGQVYNGIDGTLVGDFNPSTLKTSSKNMPRYFYGAAGNLWHTMAVYGFYDWSWSPT